MAITDLTGTKWQIVEYPSPLAIQSLDAYALDFISNNESFSSLSGEFVIAEPPKGRVYFGSTLVYYSVSGGWIDRAYCIIEITGGGDARNSTLISWLDTYATNITPVPTGSGKISVGTLSLAKTFAGTSEVIKAILNGVTLYEKITSYSITVTLTNATAASGNPSTIAQGGTATLVFTFDGTNYICPSTSPVVTGATGVWTKNSDSQGTMVLSNATGNVSFTVAGEQALPQLDTPTNLSVTDTTASFDEVENATSYEFYVDDVSIGTYTPTTLIEFSIEGTSYQAENGMTWTEFDTLNEGLAASAEYFAGGPQLSVDLSTLSGWSDVSAGSHTLKVKAKATGYRDSALSAGASFTKAEQYIYEQTGTVLKITSAPYEQSGGTLIL